MNKKTKKSLKDIFYRYFILILAVFFGLPFFYFIFEPLTVYPSLFLFKLFYNPVLMPENVITFPGRFISFEVIGACIAGSAYLLLTILNLSTPNIKLKRRLNLLAIAFLSFLVLNILRIFLIGVLFLEKVSWADFAHKLLWYIGSIVVIILIWFIQVRKHKIKEIPFYSDLKFVFNLIKK
jgi:exosortase/archaeosortase family protein